MTREQAEAQIKAAAWTVAAALGHNTASEMLKAAAQEIENVHWRR